MTLASLDAKLQDFHRRNPDHAASSLGARIAKIWENDAQAAELAQLHRKNPDLMRRKLQSWVHRTQDQIAFAVACKVPPETSFASGSLRLIGAELMDRKSEYLDIWEAFESWADRNDLQVRLCTCKAPDQKQPITTHVEITPIWSA